MENTNNHTSAWDRNEAELENLVEMVRPIDFTGSRTSGSSSDRESSTSSQPAVRDVRDSSRHQLEQAQDNCAKNVCCLIGMALVSLALFALIYLQYYAH